MPFDNIDDPGMKCFRCSARFEGNPRDHVCYDGTTFFQRIKAFNDAKLPSTKSKEEYSRLTLTALDEILLSGMKIDWKRIKKED